MYAAAPASHSPIYYVGQPLAFRMSQGPAWSKHAPVITMQASIHHRARKTPSPPPAIPHTDAFPDADVPTAVAALLAHTQQLQAVLRLWGARAAPEAHVSDAYVRAAMQLDATCAAFRARGLDPAALVRVPAELRAVLEEALGQPPSARVLDRYMPRVRAVLWRLLRALQRMQGPYWEAVERAGGLHGARWELPAEQEYGRGR